MIPSNRIYSISEFCACSPQFLFIELITMPFTSLRSNYPPPELYTNFTLHPTRLFTSLLFGYLNSTPHSDSHYRSSLLSSLFFSSFLLTSPPPSIILFFSPSLLSPLLPILFSSPSLLSPLLLFSLSILSSPYSPLLFRVQAV